MIDRLLKEPLVHFLVLGALLFLIYGLFGTVDPGARQVVVTQGDVDRLRTMWMMQWRRLPTQQELTGLIDDYVREEILYREAVAMGLDQGDTVVRRRLVQQIEFMTEDVASQDEISESDLLAFFADHRDDYLQEGRVSFTHIYLNADRRGATVAADAGALLDRLTRNPATDWEPLGDRFMLARRYDDRRLSEIGQLFGSGFGQELEAVEPNRWAGPLQSGYGLHLVRVEAREAARLPDLAAVRPRVEADFLLARRREAAENFYQRLQKDYDIVIEAQLLDPTSSGAGQ